MEAAAATAAAAAAAAELLAAVVEMLAVEEDPGDEDDAVEAKEREEEAVFLEGKEGSRERIEVEVEPSASSPIDRRKKMRRHSHRHWRKFSSFSSFRDRYSSRFDVGEAVRKRAWCRNTRRRSGNDGNEGPRLRRKSRRRCCGRR
jgi:tRNA nucleotidyltransferase (CCA-adding enzyme)